MRKVILTILMIIIIVLMIFNATSISASFILDKKEKSEHDYPTPTEAIKVYGNVIKGGFQTKPLKNVEVTVYFGLRKEAVSSVTDDSGNFEVYITISDVPLFQTITLHFTKKGYRNNFRTIDALTSITSYNLGYIPMIKKPFSHDLLGVPFNTLIKNLNYLLWFLY